MRGTVWGYGTGEKAVIENAGTSKPRGADRSGNSKGVDGGRRRG
jgi:hypothetical protein